MSATYVTTVPMTTFNLAPASPLPFDRLRTWLPRVDVLDLVIRVLAWLLAIAIRLSLPSGRHASEGEPGGPGPCCENPKLKPQEQGYSWCVNCGAVFDGQGQRRPYSSQATYYADIDRSLRVGCNLDWMRQES
jgi:hypothetical protein